MPDQSPPHPGSVPGTTGRALALLDDLDAGVVVYRLEVRGDRESLRLEHLNPAARLMLGVSASDVVGQRVFEVFPRQRASVVPDLLCEVIESGQGLHIDAAPFLLDGSELSFDVHLFPLPGQRCGAEFRDATRRVQSEQSLKTASHELRRALESLWGERDLARSIQKALLPRDGPQIPGYDTAARMHTAPIVGGDYVDAFEVNGTGWLFVGDVSGRDLPAALLAAMVQTSARSVLWALELQGIQPRPSLVIEAINAAVRANFQVVDAGQYMTLTALRLRGGRVMHAGLHQDLLVHRAATDTLDRFESEGLWVGVLTDRRLDLVDQEFQLAEGDTLLLFTDGLLDPTTSPGGQRALEMAFLELSGARLSVADLAQSILERRVVEPLRDDCTVLVARRRSRGDAH